MDCVYWLNDLNIDIALESMQLQYPHVTILTLGNQAHAQIGTNGFKQDFENTSNLIMVLWYKSHWVTVTNIDTGRSTLPISTENVPLFVYDSFDNATYLNSLQLTLNTMFPTKGEYIIHKAKIWYPQVGANDCGLFALAYVKALCLNLEPSLVTFCQSTMRHEYNEFIERNLIDYRVNIISNLTSSHNSVMTPYRIQLSLLQ